MSADDQQPLHSSSVPTWPDTVQITLSSVLERAQRTPSFFRFVMTTRQRDESTFEQLFRGINQPVKDPSIISKCSLFSRHPLLLFSFKVS